MSKNGMSECSDVISGSPEQLVHTSDVIDVSTAQQDCTEDTTSKDVIDESTEQQECTTDTTPKDDISIEQQEHTAATTPKEGDDSTSNQSFQQYYIDDIPLIINDVSVDQTAPEYKAKPDTTKHQLVALSILMFGIEFVDNMLKTTYPDFIKDKACKLYYNNTDCNNNEIQEISNDYFMYITVIQRLPGAIVIVLLGHWCDKHGSRPLIFSSLIGMLISEALMVWYATSHGFDIYYVLIFTIPFGIMGGTMVTITCVFSMVKREAPHEHTKVFTVLINAATFGVDLGFLPGGFGYKYLGPLWIFAAALVMYLLLLLHVVFFVHDPHIPLSPTTVKKKVKDVVSSQNLRENYRTITKKREGKGRTQICLLLLSIPLIVSGITGTRNITTLYTEKMFNWTIAHTSVVNTASKLSGSAVASVAVPVLINKHLISDPWLGFIGLISLCGQTLIQAFSVQASIYYVAMSVGLLGNFAMIAGRSRISKLVEENERGKMFSTLSTSEAVLPNILLLLLTKVYDLSMDVFAGMVYLVNGILLFVALVVFLWMARLADVSHYAVTQEENPTGSDITRKSSETRSKDSETTSLLSCQ